VQHLSHEKDFLSFMHFLGSFWLHSRSTLKFSQGMVAYLKYTRVHLHGERESTCHLQGSIGGE